ncbi:hypothetical protein MMC20_004460 [Loxospora ochrophaea]|nr:hypothetical protein [Loxospora ochrophaea]
MRSVALCLLALVSSLAFAKQGVERRQASTDAADFSSAASQLISQYIPQSILPNIGIAIQSAASAASITGDINSIVQSVFTAKTPPAFVTALPSSYQSDILKVESAISSLRGTTPTILPTNVTDLAPTATVNGSASLPNVTLITVNMTDSAGSTFASTITALVRGGTAVPLVVAANSTTSAATNLASSLSGATTGTGTPSGPASSTSASGIAVPTHVPVAGVGLIGFIGLLVAL